MAGIVNGVANSTCGLNTVSAANNMSGATIIMTNNINLNPGMTFDMNETTGDAIISGTNLNTFSTVPTSWVPIGTSASLFQGTFDGDRHVIKGVYVYGTSDEQGLFGRIHDAVIDSIGVENSFIKGYRGVGGIVGNMSNAVINNSYNAANINNSGTGGGIVGYNILSFVTNCYNTGTIYSTGVPGTSCGGIAGFVEGGEIENCYNGGIVKSPSGSAGGIAGTLTNYGVGLITNCYNTGEISAQYYAGGITSSNYKTIDYCYNTGEITGNISSAGGISGANVMAGIITNSHNSGTVNTVVAGTLVGEGTPAGAGCGTESITHDGIITKLNEWVVADGTGTYRSWQISAPYLV